MLTLSCHIIHTSYESLKIRMNWRWEIIFQTEWYFSITSFWVKLIRDLGHSSPDYKSEISSEPALDQDFWQADNNVRSLITYWADVIQQVNIYLPVGILPKTEIHHHQHQIFWKQTPLCPSCQRLPQACPPPFSQGKSRPAWSSCYPCPAAPSLSSWLLAPSLQLEASWTSWDSGAG